MSLRLGMCDRCFRSGVMTQFCSLCQGYLCPGCLEQQSAKMMEVQQPL